MISSEAVLIALQVVSVLFGLQVVQVSLQVVSFFYR